jgi:biotin carboxyl carrier protein
MNMRVQVDGQVYEVEIGDLNSRPIQAVVDGEMFAVWPEAATESMPSAEPPTEMGALARPASAAALPTDAQTHVVVAPLPGDIIAVAVQAGDAVTAGQLLCTVESMKMNNPVRSPRAGIVDEVMVSVGSHVNFGQPMVRLR